MWLMRVINTVLCEMSMYFEWADSYEAYRACVGLAQSAEDNQACYNRFVVAVAESTLKYVECLF